MMKVSLKDHNVHDALYRTLSKLGNGELYELKITVAPKGGESFNIAIGFEPDDLTQFVNEVGLSFENYSNKVSQTASMLLLMLDEALLKLENNHKTGSSYWRRLRVRKRLVQTILSVAGEADWKNKNELLAEEFFRASDKALLMEMTGH
jgi:hypothetical protein